MGTPFGYGQGYIPYYQKQGQESAPQTQSSGPGFDMGSFSGSQAPLGGAPQLPNSMNTTPLSQLQMKPDYSDIRNPSFTSSQNFAANYDLNGKGYGKGNGYFGDADFGYGSGNLPIKTFDFSKAPTFNQNPFQFNPGVKGGEQKQNTLGVGDNTDFNTVRNQYQDFMNQMGAYFQNVMPGELQKLQGYKDQFNSPDYSAAYSLRPGVGQRAQATDNSYIDDMISRLNSQKGYADQLQTQYKDVYNRYLNQGYFGNLYSSPSNY